MDISDLLWQSVGEDHERGSIGSRIARNAAVVSRATFTAGSLVVARHDEDILLVRETYRDQDAWGFPGGFWHKRESTLDAAIRELTEETGIPGSYASALEFVALYPQWWKYHIDCLWLLECRGTRPDASPSSHEIKECRWFPSDSLPHLTREAALAVRVLADEEAGELTDLEELKSFMRTDDSSRPREA